MEVHFSGWKPVPRKKVSILTAVLNLSGNVCQIRQINRSKTTFGWQNEISGYPNFIHDIGEVLLATTQSNFS